MDNTHRAKTVQKPCTRGSQNKKAMKSFDFTAFSGAMEGTRTPGLLIRSWEPWVRNLNECWTLPLFCAGDVQHLLFGGDRSILMESLYFYNFLYGSFIYSMLIFMHTDR